MKKIWSFLLSAALLFTISPSTYALRTGDVIGKIYSTDILAYVDGAPIESYNIGGKTVVSARTLRDYGFSVNWDEENRTVSINSNEVLGELPMPTISRGTVGRTVGNVYYTDITVQVNSLYYIDSYNIGGETMIALEDLSTSVSDNASGCNLNEKIGFSNTGFKTVWDAENRTISLTRLHQDSTVTLSGNSYQTVRLTSYFSRVPAALTLYTGDSSEPIVNGIVVVSDNYYYSMKMLKEMIAATNNSIQVTFQNGRLSIENSESSTATKIFIYDEEFYNESQDQYYLGTYSAYKVELSALLPIIKIPVTITLDGETKQIEVDGIIAGTTNTPEYEAIFIDVRTVLEQLKLIST